MSETTIKEARYERRKLSQLTNWENNPRSILDEDFARLKGQIGELGVYKTLLVNQDNIVLGGNMRLRAFIEMFGPDYEAMCGIVETADDSQMLKYALSDNDNAGTTDTQKLAEIHALNPVEMDLYKVQTAPLKTVQSVIEQYGPEPEEGEIPEVATKAVSVPGEVYQLGRHRLMCGDATKLEDVERLMDGKVAEMVFTDPPYNVDYGSNQSPIWKQEIGQIKNDNMTDEDWDVFIAGWLANVLKFARGAIYVFMSCKEWPTVQGKFVELGGHWSTTIIYNKDHFVPGRADYQRKYEPILYGWKEGNKHHFIGDRTQSDVWDFKRSVKNDSHPTMKPIELCARAIRNSSQSGDIVLDLFGGSGSTLIACDQIDRTCYMQELDPKYCDVIRKRYWMQTHDGKEEGWQDGTAVLS